MKKRLRKRASVTWNGITYGRTRHGSPTVKHKQILIENIDTTIATEECVGGVHGICFLEQSKILR